MIFINLYWKDGCFVITGGLYKHKSSCLYSQAVEVIYSLPRSGHSTDGAGQRRLLSMAELHRPVEIYRIESIY